MSQSKKKLVAALDRANKRLELTQREHAAMRKARDTAWERNREITTQCHELQQSCHKAEADAELRVRREQAVADAARRDQKEAMRQLEQARRSEAAAQKRETAAALRPCPCSVSAARASATHDRDVALARADELEQRIMRAIPLLRGEA